MEKVTERMEKRLQMKGERLRRTACKYSHDIDWDKEEVRIIAFERKGKCKWGKKADPQPNHELQPDHELPPKLQYKSSQSQSSKV